MQNLKFTQQVDAAPEKVWHVMLDMPTYGDWTKSFNPDPTSPGSTFEGSWEQGQEIRFVGTDNDGKKSGMIARVKENRPFEFVSLEHFGVITDGVEDTTSEDIKKWTPAHENYTFVKNDAGTEVQVSVDVADEYKDYFAEAWPKALLRLKELAERG